VARMFSLVGVPLDLWLSGAEWTFVEPKVISDNVLAASRPGSMERWDGDGQQNIE
jgi:hypothetical protein